MKSEGISFFSQATQNSQSDKSVCYSPLDENGEWKGAVHPHSTEPTISCKSSPRMQNITTFLWGMLRDTSPHAAKRSKRIKHHSALLLHLISSESSLSHTHTHARYCYFFQDQTQAGTHTGTEDVYTHGHTLVCSSCVLFKRGDRSCVKPRCLKKYSRWKKIKPFEN